MDIVDSATRSRMMANIRSKDTKPELAIRRLLHSKGFRFRLHQRNLPGTPDIVLPKWKVVIFVHGCFWHRHKGCPKATNPSTNPEIWQAKFAANLTRDDEAIIKLVEMGWRVIVVWECGIGRKSRADLEWIDSAIKMSKVPVWEWPKLVP